MDIAGIEASWDAAIKAAAAADAWPAYPETLRTPVPTKVMDSIADRYREVGWKVRRRKSPQTGWMISK